MSDDILLTTESKVNICKYDVLQIEGDVWEDYASIKTPKDARDAVLLVTDAHITEMVRGGDHPKGQYRIIRGRDVIYPPPDKYPQYKGG